LPEKDVRKYSSMDHGQYEPTESVSDVLASKLLSYVAFCIIIALITFIALVVWQAIYIPELPSP
jgi:hypothetical protein